LQQLELHCVLATLGALKDKGATSNGNKQWQHHQAAAVLLPKTNTSRLPNGQGLSSLRRPAFFVPAPYSLP